MGWASETYEERRKCGRTPWAGHQKHTRREENVEGPHGLGIRNIRGEKKMEDPMGWASETYEDIRKCGRTPWAGHQKHTRTYENVERPHGLGIRNIRRQKKMWKDPMGWALETYEERRKWRTPWAGHQKHTRREENGGPHGLGIRNIRGHKKMWKDPMGWASETYEDIRKCGRTPWAEHQKHTRREENGGPHGLGIRNIRGEKKI